jgi:hypothetical protein
MHIIALVTFYALFCFCLTKWITRRISSGTRDYEDYDLDLDVLIERHEEDPSRHSYWS